MPRTCTICVHPERQAIDAALLAGTPIRGIARTFRVSEDALSRHKEHVAPALAKAHEAAEVAKADDLLARVQGLVREADAILREARGEGEGRDPHLALKAIDRLTKLTELFARLAGELREGGTTVNVAILTDSPQWGALRARILDALAPYPEALEAVRRALAG